MRRFLIATVLSLPGIVRGLASPADVAYTISTVAGSDWVGDGGPATQAILFQAEGVAVDPAGNLYVSDALGNRVRQVSPQGSIHTVAGTGVRGSAGDGGPATAAQLNSPYGLALDRAGNLYIADLGNSRVRKVAVDGTMSTVAGPAGFVSPRNVALDSASNLFVSDFDTHRVVRVNADGSFTAVAGTGLAGYQGDGQAAVLAQLNHPTALAFDRSDNLYIADSQNHAIRLVSRGAIATLARVATPTGLTVDISGALQVADPSGGQILRIPLSGQPTALAIPARDVASAADGSLFATLGTVVKRIQLSGVLTTVAGGGNSAYGDAGDARKARLNHPAGLAVDASGNVYLADRDNHRIRRVSPAGVISTLAGTGEPGDSGDGGPATLARLNRPSSVSLDTAGNLYIADTGNHRVRRISPQGTILPVTRTESPVYVLPDNGGSVYVSDDSAGKVYKAVAPGPPAPSVAVPVAGGLQSPRGLALDAAGNLYIAEAGAARVRKLTPALALSDIGGSDASKVWNIPRGVALDASGNLYVADSGLQQIVRIDLSDGPTGGALPVAGNGAAGFSGDGDAALLARLGYPWDVAVGADGKVYFADLDNNRIRALSPAAIVPPAPVILADAVNAANLQAGPIVPGMLVAIRGAGIAAAEVPDTQILFGALPARLVLAEPARLMVEAPLGIPTQGSLSIEVRYKGTLRAAIPVVLAPSAPVLYPFASSEPPLPGSIVTLYGTGLGAPGLGVSVQIGGRAAEVLYAGPTASFPGVFQINARLPADLPAGAAEVVVTAGAATSPAGYTLPIVR